MLSTAIAVVLRPETERSILHRATIAATKEPEPWEFSGDHNGIVERDEGRALAHSSLSAHQ